MEPPPPANVYVEGTPFAVSYTPSGAISLAPDFYKEIRAQIVGEYKLHASLQNLNAIVALKGSLLEICAFRLAFRSLFSKGDDAMIISNMNQYIDQLRQSAETQYPNPKNTYNAIVALPLSKFQIVFNECMEHAIVVLETLLTCLTGRTTSKSGGVCITSAETYAQTYGWSGWSQIARIARAAFFCFKTILPKLKEFAKDNEDEKDMVANLGKVADGLAYVIDSFIKKKFPDATKLLPFFGDNDPIINKESFAMNNLGENENGRGGGWFSGLFN